MRVAGGLTGKKKKLLKHYSERAMDCINKEVSVIGNSTERLLQVT